jgi:hypothetical protein
MIMMEVPLRHAHGFVLKKGSSVLSVDKQSALETLVGSCRSFCQIAQHFFPSIIAIGAASAIADDFDDGGR